MLGYLEDVCKKKGVLRKEWRPVQQVNSATAGTITQVDPPLDNGSTGDPHTTPTDFTLVPRRSQAKQLRASSPERGQSPAYNESHQNSFHALSIARSPFILLWCMVEIMSNKESNYVAWCIIGDFNSILYREDRIRGNEVTEYEIQELTSFMEDCDTISSRIDRVLINGLWHEVFDYTTVKYLTNGLLDHTSMLIQFPTTPKPSP
ncbi:hypothetical protein Cgig2_021815 [Carnegiea gigantea]|uniref:Uncharacterized protein n=1 Tax=Carnegiea gigantea TaxID=171969 RepID=A0A9Q1GI08_9CARY|nr:hypothetical protein Cgig2_021815 [Carnegiea gigantea]